MRGESTALPCFLSITRPLQPRIHRLTLQGQHPENTLMHATQRLAAHEAFQCFHAQGKLSQGEGMFSGEARVSQADEMGWGVTGPQAHMRTSGQASASIARLSYYQNPKRNR